MPKSHSPWRPRSPAPSWPRPTSSFLSLARSWMMIPRLTAAGTILPTYLPSTSVTWQVMGSPQFKYDDDPKKSGWKGEGIGLFPPPLSLSCPVVNPESRSRQLLPGTSILGGREEKSAKLPRAVAQKSLRSWSHLATVTTHLLGLPPSICLAWGRGFATLSAGLEGERA